MAINRNVPADSALIEARPLREHFQAAKLQLEALIGQLTEYESRVAAMEAPEPPPPLAATNYDDGVSHYDDGVSRWQ